MNETYPGSDLNNQALTISNEPLPQSAMDFDLLRQEGIQYLEQLSGNIWTDFNTHDPGITILEQLCYALTDLSYRIDYDIKDLLAGEGTNAYDGLFTPQEVLTTNPLTILDFRKLIIDIPGVKNAWIEQTDVPSPEIFRQKETELYTDNEEGKEKEVYYYSTYLNELNQSTTIQGLYKVVIEKDYYSSIDGAEIVNEARARLNSVRTLCEDFEEVIILPVEEISLKLALEIDAEDADALLARVLFRIEEAVSPGIHFYSLYELQAKGLDAAEIFEGPSLQHGFIMNEELLETQRKDRIYSSDLIREIMKEEGVLVVKDILLISGSVSNSWKLDVDASKTPFFNGEGALNQNGKAPLHQINIFRKKMKVEVNARRVLAILNELRNTTQRKILTEKEKNIRLPERRDRSVSKYFSVQHHLPEVYGVGHAGLPESASEIRKIQAKQLQGYLLIFDQLLANDFAQLAHVKDLFSFQSNNMEGANTYFTQFLEEVPGAYDLLKTEFTEFEEDERTDAYINTERKNRFLNHLLSRFGESFDHSDSAANKKLESSEEKAKRKVEDKIEDKMAFLKDYPKISCGRGTGYNYASGGWNSDNISGLEKRIARMLGIADYKRRTLTGNKEEGFHMIEHILLRPSNGDLGQTTEFLTSSNPDPYSFQVSFVFPDWIGRFANNAFRALASKIIREETPAHIIVNIKWLNKDKLAAFEEFYKKWINTKSEK